MPNSSKDESCPYKNLEAHSLTFSVPGFAHARRFSKPFNSGPNGIPERSQACQDKPLCQRELKPCLNHAIPAEGCCAGRAGQNCDTLPLTHTNAQVEAPKGSNAEASQHKPGALNRL